MIFIVNYINYQQRFLIYNLNIYWYVNNISIKIINLSNKISKSTKYRDHYYFLKTIFLFIY